MYDIGPDAILDAIAIPAFTVETRTGEPVYKTVNAAYTELCGITTSQAEGRTARELLGEAAGTNAMRCQYRVARTGQPESFTMLHPCRDGDRTFRTSLSPVTPLSPQPASIVVGTMIDLEYLDPAETPDLTLLNAEEVRQFITLAAHDLRAPMRQVATIARLLTETDTQGDEESRELISMLSELGEKSQALISEVLDYARVVDLPKVEGKFDFGMLCRDIFGVLDSAHRHDLQGCEAQVVADRTAVQIILRNLIDNAIKHAGHERVKLSVALRAAPADMVEIVVTDDGQGFADPSIAFLAGGKFRYGTGFGLLALKRLVTSRAGLIYAVTPDGGTGAEIHCLIPGRLLPAH